MFCYQQWFPGKSSTAWKWTVQGIVGKSLQLLTLRLFMLQGCKLLVSHWLQGILCSVCFNWAIPEATTHGNMSFYWMPWVAETQSQGLSVKAWFWLVVWRDPPPPHGSSVVILKTQGEWPVLLTLLVAIFEVCFWNLFIMLLFMDVRIVDVCRTQTHVILQGLFHMGPFGSDFWFFIHVGLRGTYHHAGVQDANLWDVSHLPVSLPRTDQEVKSSKGKDHTKEATLFCTLEKVWDHERLRGWCLSLAYTRWRHPCLVMSPIQLLTLPSTRVGRSGVKNSESRLKLTVKIPTLVAM